MEPYELRRELALFAGAGGGLLAGKLLGLEPVGYVEWDGFCQEVLEVRIRDGVLAAAPIWGDIRAFLREGIARSYRGVADVVTAGFPCVAFSVAGKRLGGDDDRNLWPETIGILRDVRPRLALLENAAGLASHEYFGTVLGDLADAGFDAEFGTLRASDVGAPHERNRLWIAAWPRDLSDAERDGVREFAERNLPGEAVGGDAGAGDDGA